MQHPLARRRPTPGGPGRLVVEVGEDRVEDLVAGAEPAEVPLLGPDPERGPGDPFGQVLAVGDGHDDVRVAVPQVHRDADAAQREAPRPTEEHGVHQERLHVSPRSEQDVFEEHLPDAGVAEDPLIARRHEAREEVHRATADRLERGHDARQHEAERCAREAADPRQGARVRRQASRRSVVAHRRRDTAQQRGGDDAFGHLVGARQRVRSAPGEPGDRDAIEPQAVAEDLDVGGPLDE